MSDTIFGPLNFPPHSSLPHWFDLYASASGVFLWTALAMSYLVKGTPCLNVVPTTNLGSLSRAAQHFTKTLQVILDVPSANQSAGQIPAKAPEPVGVLAL